MGLSAITGTTFDPVDCNTFCDMDCRETVQKEIHLSFFPMFYTILNIQQTKNRRNLLSVGQQVSNCSDHVVLQNLSVFRIQNIICSLTVGLSSNNSVASKQ